jgi:hypothetical protein
MSNKDDFPITLHERRGYTPPIVFLVTERP